MRVRESEREIQRGNDVIEENNKALPRESITFTSGEMQKRTHPVQMRTN